MSLKFKIALLTLLTTLVVGLTSAFWSVTRMQSILEQELTERGHSIGSALAETLISQVTQRDQVGVIHGLKRVKRESEDIDYIYVVDFDNQLFGHTFEGGFPEQLQKRLAPLDPDQPYTTRTFNLNGVEVLEVSLPLIGSMGAHVSIGLDGSFQHEQIEKTGLTLLGVSMAIGLVFSVIASLIGQYLLSPITLLAEQMSRYGRGERVQPEAIGNISGGSEIEVLATRFADMIRDRRTAENELRQIKLSLDNTQDAVFMFYPDSLKFFYINHSAEVQLGYSRDELLNMTPVDIQPRFKEMEFRSVLDPLISGQLGSHTFETVQSNKAGADIPVEIHLQYMIDGEPPHFLAIVRNISERKRAEANLQRLNRDLERRVTERTAELAGSNEQLRETLRTLQQAQQELVRSEKLASLGSLVAGVAHELNTPLGNAVTLSTTMHEWLENFRKELAAGQLRKSSLTQYLDRTEEANTLLTRNLTSAAELISDFKQVAVDQTSAQRRDFDLNTVVTEITETLQPQFKKSPHRIETDIPEGIRMDSFPGPLGQVITNLALNALLHGFESVEEGVVQIKAQPLPGGRIELTVSDNGCGIPPEHATRIFDPFFTTKLGKGGSGLGMHIVYTLVTRVLGGTIDLGRSASGGALLTMQLPLVAPQKQEDPGQA